MWLSRCSSHFCRSPNLLDLSSQHVIRIGDQPLPTIIRDSLNMGNGMKMDDSLAGVGTCSAVISSLRKPRNGCCTTLSLHSRKRDKIIIKNMQWSN